MNDILQVLETEHEKLRALLRSLDGTNDQTVASRVELLAQIEQQLLPHAKWEETVLYPEFAKCADAEGLKLHAGAVEEHRIVEKTVLPDLKGADASSLRFAGTAKVLRTLIDSHSRDEEQHMFAICRRLFTVEERADLALRYEEWKKSPTAVALIAGAKLKSTLKSALPG